VLNPFRSEDEAFRFLLRAVAVLIIVIALIHLTRAIL
jgi:hypothetical protein